MPEKTFELNGDVYHLRGLTGNDAEFILQYYDEKTGDMKGRIFHKPVEVARFIVSVDCKDGSVIESQTDTPVMGIESIAHHLGSLPIADFFAVATAVAENLSAPLDSEKN